MHWAARKSLRVASRSNALEDPWDEPSESMFTRSVSPEQAPDKPTYIEIEFEQGDPVAVNGTKLSPATLLTALNKVAGENGAQAVAP
jgi:argininosuccinate synthase